MRYVYIYTFLLDTYHHKYNAAIAQLGERKTEDLKVPGSIPGGGMRYSFFFCWCSVYEKNVSVAQWITHPPPKWKIAGSNPVRDIYCATMTSARLAQMVERKTLNLVVAGSIPAVGNFKQHLKDICVDSSMVRILAFQARGPGSIPGRRTQSV